MIGDGRVAQNTTSTLIGCDTELARLRRARAATEPGAVLIVRSPTGIGKTALPEHVAAAAGDYRVTRRPRRGVT